MKKSLIFKILYLFLVLIVVAGASVFATNTYLASQVSYGNTNVEDALNGLFQLKENTYNYSTDEQIIGKWINNKPIYRKTLIYEDPSQLSVGYHQEEHHINNIDLITNIDIMYVRHDGFFIPSPNGQNDSKWNTMNAGASKTQIDYNIGSELKNTYAIEKIYININYTKTTNT